jgi:hypothetical protein
MSGRYGGDGIGPLRAIGRRSRKGGQSLNAGRHRREWRWHPAPEAVKPQLAHRSQTGLDLAAAIRSVKRESRSKRPCKRRRAQYRPNPVQQLRPGLSFPGYALGLHDQHHR